MYNRTPNRLFRNSQLSDRIKRQEMAIAAHINSEKDEYLATVDQEEYLKFIQDKFEILTPVILDSQIETKPEQRKITIYDSFSREPIQVDGFVVDVFIPLEGDSSLLLAQANTWSSCAPEGRIDDNKIVITVQMPVHNAEGFDLEKVISTKINDIKTNIGYLDKDLKNYNNGIKLIAQNAINTKVSNYQKFNNFVKSIPYQVKRETNIPTTFEIPKVVRKPKIAKPIAGEKIIISEPTLEIEEYNHILKICSDMALVIERSPNAFANIGEEDLRTHFLLQLNGHYQGQATGETFNAAGKTDILIRDDNKNVFIGECKFWKGEKVYLATIDQLLGYVTYRDTKTAILIFDKSKDFTNTLAKIQEITPNHKNFVRQDLSYKPPVESSFRYVFKNKDDNDKELLLTIIAFHIPTKMIN